MIRVHTLQTLRLTHWKRMLVQEVAESLFIIGELTPSVHARGTYLVNSTCCPRVEERMYTPFAALACHQFSEVSKIWLESRIFIFRRHSIDFTWDSPELAEELFPGSHKKQNGTVTLRCLLRLCWELRTLPQKAISSYKMWKDIYITHTPANTKFSVDVPLVCAIPQADSYFPHTFA